MTLPSWVALHGMAHGFIGLQKTLQHNKAVMHEGESLKAKGEGVAEDELVGWHHRLSGRECEQTPGDSERQRGLGCCSQSLGLQSQTPLSNRTTTTAQLLCLTSVELSFPTAGRTTFSCWKQIRNENGYCAPPALSHHKTMRFFFLLILLKYS